MNKIVINNQIFVNNVNKIINKSKSKKNLKKGNISKNKKISQHKLKNVKLNKLKTSSSSINNFLNNHQNIIGTNKISHVKLYNNCRPDTDYELNWLLYEEALRFDKRTNCDYYGALIKSKQLFIFTFCSFNDYNSGILKKFVFFYHLLFITL